MGDTDDGKRGSGGFKSGPGAVFGTLEPVFPDLWWAWGTTRFMPGVLFPRSMVIVREKGELVIIHPVLMPEAEQAKIEALGPIKHIVRLGAFHGMDDARYVERYKPTTWAPPGVDLSPGVRLDRALTPGGPQPFADGRVLGFESSRTPETVIHLPRHGGILLSCDSVQNWETRRGTSFIGGLMSRAMGFKGRACIGPGWRKFAEPKDGVGFSREFLALLALDFRHAIGGHGGPMLETAREDLRAQVRRIYQVG